MLKRILALLLVLLALIPSALAERDEVVITLGGDCVLGTREKWKQDADTFDTLIAEQGWDWCFAKISEPFQTDDISLVNLEGVLQSTSKGHARGKQYTFRGNPSYGNILKAAGIEAVNIANNHYIDFGRDGRESTRAALKEAGIDFSGYTYRAIREVNGYRIGFAGCRETVFRESSDPALRDLRYLKKKKCDVIIYSCHWGEEYSPTHNKWQERMADYLIRNGADLVVGTHPHCVQGIAQVRGGVVIWSLGNLVFGGTHDMTTFDALVVQARLAFERGKYVGATLELMPVLTSSDRPRNNFQPEWAVGADYERIMKLIQDDSTLEIQREMWFPVK